MTATALAAAAEERRQKEMEKYEGGHGVAARPDADMLFVLTMGLVVSSTIASSWWLDGIPANCADGCLTCEPGGGGCLVCQPGHMNAGRACFSSVSALPAASVGKHPMMMMLIGNVQLFGAVMVGLIMHRSHQLALTSGSITSFLIVFVAAIVFALRSVAVDAVLLSELYSNQAYRYFEVPPLECRGVLPAAHCEGSLSWLMDQNERLKKANSSDT